MTFDRLSRKEKSKAVLVSGEYHSRESKEKGQISQGENLFSLFTNSKETNVPEEGWAREK